MAPDSRMGARQLARSSSMETWLWEATLSRSLGPVTVNQPGELHTVGGYTVTVALTVLLPGAGGLLPVLGVTSEVAAA